MRLDVARECFCAGRRAGDDAQERSHLRGAWENGHAAQLAEDGRQLGGPALRIKLVGILVGRLTLVFLTAPISNHSDLLFYKSELPALISACAN